MKNNIGTLRIVSTPIGNLSDITYRAVDILKDSHIIAAEDTRVSRKLLNHYDIETKMISYFEHNKFSRIKQIMATLSNGMDVAVISPVNNYFLKEFSYNPDEINHFSMSRIVGLGLSLIKTNELEDQNFNSEFIVKSFSLKDNRENLGNEIKSTTKSIQEEIKDNGLEVSNQIVDGVNNLIKNCTTKNKHKNKQLLKNYCSFSKNIDSNGPNSK